MTWPVRAEPGRIDLHVHGRISEADAARQQGTVAEILRRFDSQPGLVLADEVGMGKTYVALAVAAAAAWADRKRRPVVVMVPPSVREKWPRDFETFKAHCVREVDGAGKHLRCRTATTAVDFLRLLDDPPRQRAHIVFLTHGAFHRALQDPWLKLAILKRALAAGSLKAQRLVMPRFAGPIIRAARYQDEGLFESLLESPFHRWRAIVERFTDKDLGDDPVPEAIADVLEGGQIDLEELRAGLRALPLRRSAYLEERLLEVRRTLNNAIRSVWEEALVTAQVGSPLLIMDEAHHLKNPETRLASLFVERDAQDDARYLEGALHGTFERMLFLTATPFQLGHHELLSIIRRFGDVRWGRSIPASDGEAFRGAIDDLERRLEEAQRSTTQLDHRWSSLDPGELGLKSDEPEAIEAWWSRVRADPEELPERYQPVVRSFARARGAMQEAEAALRPWVIRHVRPRCFSGSSVDRREELVGASILGGQPTSLGLEVREGSILPFLLAARSQAVVRGTQNRGAEIAARGSTYAEGLASSYEAFLETRAGSGKRLSDEDEFSQSAGVEAPQAGAVAWYLTKLRAALPSMPAFAGHPKIAPTVERSCDLWEQGEKVLVFCHYRATGTALTQHISAELERRIRQRGARALGCVEGEVGAELDRIGERFDPGRPIFRELEAVVHRLVADQRTLDRVHTARILDVVRRFVRTPAFLVRFFPLEADDPNVAFADALGRPDSSGLSLVEKLTGFVDFIANRCEPQLCDEYLEALASIRTGAGAGGEMLPSVRRATGLDSAEVRRRSLLGFNTPFFPEILVASSVLAEGVDLHLDCRHVIHHDLSWNPSTLEQRTGRIDRIAAKAERVCRPIQVYLPFIAETQDEKMYRVVRDRERWFQVLMGGDYAPDEALMDRAASRLPLPESAARELSFRLEVVGGE